jgi:hypothetical protein
MGQVATSRRQQRGNTVFGRRFWGFVPDENIVGRAFLIWMNFGNLGRVGSFR